MTTGRIDVVLWDFNGVFTGSPILGLEEYGERIGAGGLRMIDWMFGYSLDDGDHPWHRAERGEGSFMGALEACVQAAEEAGFELDRRELLMSLSGGESGVRTVVVDKVRELRDRGIRHGIVTNSTRELAQRWRSMVPVDELFDVVVDSCEVGCRKPSPTIYELALKGLHDVSPQRTVFLDDYESNVEAAKALGMHGIVVGADVREALAELDALTG